MARYAHTVIIYFFAFWLLAAFVPVYAGGRQETDLSRADALIAERKYDQAIQLLTEYARRYPQRFDHAQQRLRQIAGIREEFTRTADMLIHTLLNDPDNDERILELTIRLGELESDTSPFMTSFVARTREIALFNVYRNRLLDILVRGRDALDRGSPAEAMLIYAEGRNIMRNEFFEAGFGTAVENEVIAETGRVNRVLDTFQALSVNINMLSYRLVAAINAGNIALAQQLISDLLPEMDSFFGLQYELLVSANSFDNILNQLRAADPEIGDRNHLAFLSLIIHGRQDDVQEGMLGVFESYWNTSIMPVITAITNNASAAYIAGLAAFNAGNFEDSAVTHQRAYNISNLSPVFFERNARYNEGGRRPVVRILDTDVLQSDIQSYVSLRTIREAAFHLALASAPAGRIRAIGGENNTFTLWQAGTISTIEALNNEQQTRNTITGIRNEITNILADANRADEILSVFHFTGQLKEAITAMENFNSILNERELLAAYYFYTIANIDLWRSLDERRAELETGRLYLEGHSLTREDGITIIDRFPAQALQTLTETLARLDNNIEQGNTFQNNQRNESNEIRQDVRLIEVISGTAEVVNELTSLRSEGLTMAHTARQNTAQATVHRLEAERLFRESQAAFQAQNFETARDRLHRSQEHISNFLAIQASESLRRQWDDQLLDLGQQISVVENQMIIVEVRNLVNTARQTYFAGNFQQAEENLMRARNMWRITNAEENQEIMHWLGIVRSAMSARSGRVIPVTAPLFPEMSQLLSEANRNFEEGVRHINAGRHAQGLARFEESRQQTREVRLLYPINQEAGILELRIEQFTDPAAFNNAFAQRLAASVNAIRTTRSLEAFADLLNLAEINPNYPGIRGMVLQAEIDMGFRPPPPNPADLARSRDLTVSANNILIANNTILFEAALSQVNEAIILNPENIEATRVKDQLLNRMHLPTTIVLSSEDEAEYQRAVREFSAGNSLVALAIVQRLMQTPRNHNVLRLVDLERRIRAVL